MEVAASSPVVLVVPVEHVHIRKIQIPKAHHKAIFWKLGELEKKTGAVISNVKEKSETIVIKGNKDCIQKAVDVIRAISELQSKLVTEKLLIPKIYHPFLKLHEIYTNEENENNESEDNLQRVKIKTPRHYIMKDEIELTGAAEEVAKCAQKLHAQYETILGYNFKTKSLKVDKDEHKFIVGPRGVHISDIFTRTNVSVEVPLYESDSETITLRGPEESLEQAMQHAEEYLEKGRNSYTETIQVRLKQLQLILSKTAAINEIRDQLGVKIHIPEASDMNYTKLIKVVGKKDAILDAKQRILAILDNVTITRDINIKPEYLKKTLQSIRKKFSEVNIAFPNSKEKPNLVTVSGPSSQVEEVNNVLADAVVSLMNKSGNPVNDHESNKSSKHEQLHTKIKSLSYRKKDANNNPRIFTPSKNKVGEKKIPTKQTYNVRINPLVYSRIIGLMGRAVRKIERDNKVHIQFPKPNDAIPDDVIITGMDRKNIESARAILVDLEMKYMKEGTPVNEGKKSSEEKEL